MKEQFCKKLIGKAYNFQSEAMNAFRDWVKYQKTKDADRDKILKRLANKATRNLGQALRMLRVHCKDRRERQRNLLIKKRGICRRIVESNARLQGMGYNKLIDFYKQAKANLLDRVKFIIRALRNKDLQYFKV